MTAVLLGVIDGHAGFLHPLFRRENGASRVRAYWDQSERGTADPAKPWATPTAFGYGRELQQPAVEQALKQVAGASEAEVYAGLNHPAPAWSHAQHVAALMGAGPTQAPSPHLPCDDAAAQADFALVQLPREVIANTHGLWLNCFVLDALHYLLSHTGPEECLIVNISMGAHNGPHDGSDLLGQAITSLVTAQQGRLTVVVAAGNAAQSRSHACVRLKPGGSASLPLRLHADEAVTNFIELWAAPAQRPAAAQVSAQWCPPGDATGAPAPVTLDGQPQLRMLWALGPEGQPAPSAMLHAGGWSGPNGQGLQLLAGVAPCAPVFGSPQAKLPAAAPGLWTLKLEHRGQEGAPEVELHAWLTRNDRDGADGQPPRRSEGFDQSCDEGLISPHGTLAGLACSEGVIAVGGYHWQPPTAAQAEASFLDPDSSLGLAPHGGLPARPEVHAPSAMVFHGDVRGVGSVGYLGDAPPPDDRLGRGTSMAAPWVARQCANRLAVRGPLRRQHLLKELQAAPATLPLLLKDAPQDKRP